MKSWVRSFWNTLASNLSSKYFPRIKITVYDYFDPFDYLPIIYDKLYNYMSANDLEKRNLVFKKYILGRPTQYDIHTKIGFPV